MSQVIKIPRTRKLGSSEMEISSLAWGMWRFCGDDVPHARSLIEAALESGITLFDTADIYGPDNDEPFGASEALLGRVFAESPDLRARMILATKGGIAMGVPYDSSAAYLTSAIDASLTRLSCEQVELWQIHRPDILTHPQEIARALDDAYQAGKLRAVGVSNFTTAQIANFHQFTTVPFVTTQPQLSPLELTPIEDGQLDQAIGLGLAPLAWSPLGGGRIAEPDDERSHDVAAALDKVAENFDVSRTAAAYSWIMAHPARPVPIIGSQNAERIKEAQSSFQVEWTRQLWYDVLAASMGEPLP